jgi:hypothetical protein
LCFFKFNSYLYAPGATATYVSNASLTQAYVAEAAARPVLVMPAEGVCKPGQNAVCQFGFCQNSSLSSFEEYAAYPPVGDIRWNRTSTLINDYRSVGLLGYPCSKQLNWTEIAQVSPATYYVSDAAHGSTAGNASTTHQFTVAYGTMSVYHSVVTVKVGLCKYDPVDRWFDSRLEQLFA